MQHHSSRANVLGAGFRDVKGWTKTVEQESKQETDTPSFLKVMVANFL